MQFEYIVLMSAWDEGGTFKKGKWIWVDDDKNQMTFTERLNSLRR